MAAPRASDAAPSLPVLRSGPVDVMRDGAVSFAHTALARHPVETIQREHVKESFESELYLAERVHGGALAWERRMDAAALKCVARLPGGPPSSYVLLDSLMGRDGKLELEEALNLPEHRPVGPKKSPTELFEQQARW